MDRHARSANHLAYRSYTVFTQSFFDLPSITISAHFEERDTACAYRDYWIAVQGCLTLPSDPDYFVQS